jgi:hypothetical protein
VTCGRNKIDHRGGTTVVLVFPDTALVYLLTQVVGVKLTYNLFINDVKPDVSTTLGTLTRANWSSYGPIDVPLAAWTFSAVDAHVGELRALDLFWVNNSPGTVSAYGYYIVDATGTVLVGAARFDNAPIVVPVLKYFQVTPLLGSFSGLPS